jgi:LmbE family N-acetylglucosaminyl deacetylase
LSQEEQARLEMLNRVLQRQMEVAEAARVLGVSERQTSLDDDTRILLQPPPVTLSIERG